VLTVYGVFMPMRILEEIRFWKMQEKEHTLVIRKLLPALEPEYVKLLDEWEEVFAATENRAQQFIDMALRQNLQFDERFKNEIVRLMQASVSQSQEFVRHLFQLMQRSAVIRQNAAAKVVIEHIIRESEYFLGILHAFRSSEAAAETFGEYRTKEAEIASADSADSLTPEGTWSEPLTERRAVPIGGHTLPPLPYDAAALEPHIDEQTMRIHHDRHHQSYVDGLNKAEMMMQRARQTNDYELIKHWEREAAFNGAGHYLHTIFWNVMSPRGGGEAAGPIARQIERDFGSFRQFKEHFSQAAEKVEGGGWAILVWSPRSQRLEILQAEKHQNLSQWDVIPLLVLDVWEHAYYLKYRNNRKAYIQAWWNVVNWEHVNERFASASRLQWTPY
jgi:Fe-Mn family superoxide dismutase